MATSPVRSIAHVEADLSIQWVLVQHERTRRFLPESHPDVRRLDELLEEWQALQAHAEMA